MRRTPFALWLAGALLSAGCAPATSQIPARSAPPRKNVIVILADDLGWRDVGFQGSTFYETPHLDRLAADGMRFSQFYAAAPLCSPTRAALLTGQAPARLWLTSALTAGDYGKTAGSGTTHDASIPVVPPFIRDRLSPETVTIAEQLRESGYRTGFFGKWHLGPQGVRPEDHGFDVNLGGGHYPSPPSYFSPYKIHNLPDGPPGEYITDRLTDETIRFLRENRDRPFLAYLAHYAVHGPWQAPKDLVEKYRKKAEGAGGSQGHPIYAAMIERLDASVGRIRAALRELGLEERTAIVFTSDNGGLLRVPGESGKSRGGKESLPPGTAITSNAPLRGGKAWIHDGGLRVPAVVLWPGVTKPGGVCGVPAVTMDLHPTILAMAGAAGAPETGGRDPEVPPTYDTLNPALDGIDLTPWLRDSAATSPPRPLYFHFPHYIAGYRENPGERSYWARPSSAVREGDWKLIRYFDGTPDELYNLAEDVGETKNRAADMPERVAILGETLTAWLKETGAQIPTKNPAYRR